MLILACYENIKICDCSLDPCDLGSWVSANVFKTPLYSVKNVSVCSIRCFILSASVTPSSSVIPKGTVIERQNPWTSHSPFLFCFRCGSVKDSSLVACAFSPDGGLFVTGSSGGDLTVWDDRMRCLHSEKAHDLGITCCSFSPQPLSGWSPTLWSMGSLSVSPDSVLWVAVSTLGLRASPLYFRIILPSLISLDQNES